MTWPSARIADSPGVRMGVPVSTPNTPTFVIDLRELLAGEGLRGGLHADLMNYPRPLPLSNPVCVHDWAAALNLYVWRCTKTKTLSVSRGAG